MFRICDGQYFFGGGLEQKLSSESEKFILKELCLRWTPIIQIENYKELVKVDKKKIK
jgi:hypothetical protein